MVYHVRMRYVCLKIPSTKMNQRMNTSDHSLFYPFKVHRSVVSDLRGKKLCWWSVFFISFWRWNFTCNLYISHKRAVNSRYFLYVYWHLIILSFITNTLIHVSHPHLTLRRDIPTDIFGNSKTNQRMSIYMDCFGKHGVTRAKSHLTTFARKSGTSWI
jgi:hypothetical protein